MSNLPFGTILRYPRKNPTTGSPWLAVPSQREIRVMAITVSEQLPGYYAGTVIHLRGGRPDRAGEIHGVSGYEIDDE